MIMKDAFSLAGRTALVTGATRGIGRMIAQGFLEQGAKGFISGRKPDQTEAVAQELSALGECHGLAVNASGADGARELADAYLSKANSLDILVHNAGAAWGAPFAEFPESGWDKVMDLNVKTPFFLTQALYEALKANARPDNLSKVIMVSSVDGFFVNPLNESYSYHASKAGVSHLAKRMAMRLIRDHIVVSTINPGAFPTDMNKAARDDPDGWIEHIPAQRVGRPLDMAAAAVYLASRAGDYVVGSALTVDGGVSWGF
ncbi:MAG: SDR family oxidoreductase [Minwuia sp.]|nr:SDR family oxidoreductase [Minwuia sp.]